MKVWKRSALIRKKKARGTLIFISLGQAIVSFTVFGSEQTFINCLSPIDLELLFLGTILFEMDDLDQISPAQTLIHLWDWEKRIIGAQFYISKRAFDCLKLWKLSFFHKDLFVSNSLHKVRCHFSIPRQRYRMEFSSSFFLSLCYVYII